MQKSFTTTLKIAVTLNVTASNEGGEVVITMVEDTFPVSADEVMDSLSDDDLEALDADFAAAE